jgi:hypothetical protein
MTALRRTNADRQKTLQRNPQLPRPQDLSPSNPFKMLTWHGPCILTVNDPSADPTHDDRFRPAQICTMTKAGKRLLDLGLLLFGFLLVVALLNVDRMAAGASRVVAISIIGWLMASLPLGMLIGHCALGED